MESLAKSDIFFVITSVSVIVLTVVLAVAGYYVIKIMKDFAEVSKILKNSVQEAHDGLQSITDHVEKSPLFGFIFGKKSRTKK